GVAPASRAAGAAQGRAVEVRPRVRQALARTEPERHRAREEERRGLVLFLDIAGYTKLSEQLEPKRLNHLVQTYFSSFLEIIQLHHGDISETAGDGLMVIFQSDRGAADHALSATRAAFAIRQRTAALTEEYGGA